MKKRGMFFPAISSFLTTVLSAKRTTKAQGEILLEEKKNTITISNPKELDAVRNNLEACYLLLCDIDLADWNGFEPIGDRETPFTGIFDGNGYSIKHLHMIKTENAKDDVASDGIALFGCVSGGLIKRLGVTQAVLKLTYHGGAEPSFGNASGIVRDLENSRMEECCFEGSVEVKTTGAVFARASGLAGWVCQSSILNCYSNGNVLASAETMNTVAAGITYWLDDSRIENCYVEGSVEGKNEDGCCYVGAIYASANAGYMEYGERIKGCVSLLFKLVSNGKKVRIENYLILKPDSEGAANQETYVCIGWDFKKVWRMRLRQRNLRPSLCVMKKIE